ncbi:MAG: L,D-transpeptidase, partial [Roseimicrobium sp.]
MKPSPSHFPSQLALALLVVLLSSCATTKPGSAAPSKASPLVVIGPADQRLVISVAEQKMALFERGRPFAVVPVSTSKFGLGDAPGSNRTPLGRFEVAEVIGKG